MPESELVRRIGSRIVCEDCGANRDQAGQTMPPGRCLRCGGSLVQRTDDSASILVERLKVYRRTTKPLADYYSERPTFQTVDGAQAADCVAAALTGAIEKSPVAVETAGAGSMQRRNVRRLRRGLRPIPARVVS